MHEKTIGFRHEIKGLKQKIQNFNRVQLTGFSNYNEFYEKSKKMVEEAQYNKFQRDKKRKEFGLRADNGYVRHMLKTERKKTIQKIKEAEDLRKRITKTLVR
mmetsp:Transcript_9802/g.11080  ORF Transcript_9802/g.11080 Transcript_9802/m.11080 type:complete len:102 (+) Transcript_9802:273-578(+)